MFGMIIFHRQYGLHRDTQYKNQAPSGAKETEMKELLKLEESVLHAIENYYRRTGKTHTRLTETLEIIREVIKGCEVG